jgi:hypothetical protein
MTASPISVAGSRIPASEVLLSTLGLLSFRDGAAGRLIALLASHLRDGRSLVKRRAANSVDPETPDYRYADERT